MIKDMDIIIADVPSGGRFTLVINEGPINENSS